VPSLPETVPERPSHSIAVELSVAASAHRGDGQSSASLGASSLLDAAGWLIGFAGRVDQYGGGSTTGGASPALELGVLTGRRFRLRSLALDLVGGPAIALRGAWRVAMVNDASAGATSTMRTSSSNQELVPRVVLGGRVTLGARSIVRTF